MHHTPRRLTGVEILLLKLFLRRLWEGGILLTEPQPYRREQFLASGIGLANSRAVLSYAKNVL